MGHYHPHGDSSIYGALVNLGQPWSTKYPLIEKQGNYGSEDGDQPAASRYTEGRLSWLSMEISQKTNPTPATAQTASTMKAMNLMMPIMSIWICFVMPAALGIYWIANSVLGIVRDYGLTKIYRKKLDEEDAERRAAQQAREEEMQRRREETERLRAEGNTVRNKNTSKKNVQAKQKQESDERKAAVERAEREARRERLGLAPEEVPASQVGNRRYARGRAYDPNRFANVAAPVDTEVGTETEEVQE